MKALELIFIILLFFYANTFLVGPGILGFLFGRYLKPYIVRYLMVVWVAVVGYTCCRYSAHGFSEIFIPGNFLYATGIFLGTFFRKKKPESKFSVFQILDGILILLITILCMCLYIRPTA